MKKIQSLILILLIPVVLSLFNYACTPNYIRFFLNSMYLKNIDFSGEYPQVIDTNLVSSISSTAYGIDISLGDSTGIQYYLANTYRASFISSAFAFSPNINRYTTDMVTDIRIYNLLDFDDSHPANSEITEYFVAANGSTPMPYESLYITLDELITWLNSGQLSYRFQLFLKNYPQQADSLQFKVEVDINTLQTIIDTTQLTYIVGN